MSKLADSIERFIMQGQQLKGSFFDMFIHGFEIGVKNSKPFIDLMMNLRSALWATMEAGRAVGRAFVDTFPGVTKMLTSLSAMFEPKRFGNLLAGVTNAFKTFFKTLNTGDLVDNLQKAFQGWFNVNSASGKSLMDGTKQFFTALSKILASGVKWFVPKLTEIFKDLSSFLRDPKKYLDLAQAGSGAGKSFMMEILEPLIDAAKDTKMWSDLWSAFKDFSGQFWDLLLNKAIKPMLSSLPTGFWLTVAGIIFGPAAVSSLFSKGIEVISKGLLNVFFKSMC
jgi:hypothetical protein